MKGGKRLLISAIVVGVFAFVLFSASAFYYTNLQEITRVCSRYSVSDCHTSESIRVTLASLKFGIAYFFTMGSIAWIAFTLIALKWTQTRTIGRLP